MRYVFNRTEGEANKHLHPCYTRDEDNKDPFESIQEMFDLLDSIYRNRYHVRNSRNAYRELQIQHGQSFQDFLTEFLHLANRVQIPAHDRFDDLYEKITVQLLQQVVQQLHTFNEDLTQLCEVLTGINVAVKRINSQVTKEKESQNARLAAAARVVTSTSPAVKRSVTPATTPAGNGPSIIPRPQVATLPIQAPRQDIRCYNCGTPGHIASQCQKPKRTDIKEIEVTDGDLAITDGVEPIEESGNEPALSRRRAS